MSPVSTMVVDQMMYRSDPRSQRMPPQPSSPNIRSHKAPRPKLAKGEKRVPILSVAANVPNSAAVNLSHNSNCTKNTKQTPARDPSPRTQTPPPVRKLINKNFSI